MKKMKCEADCTCQKHRKRSSAERALIGERMREAAQRRKDWGTKGWGTGGFRCVHRRCVRCGRLLVPDNGTVPRHRIPRRKGHLTGMDSPWCDSKRFAPNV